MKKEHILGNEITNFENPSVEKNFKTLNDMTFIDFLDIPSDEAIKEVLRNELAIKLIKKLREHKTDEFCLNSMEYVKTEDKWKDDYHYDKCDCKFPKINHLHSNCYECGGDIDGAIDVLMKIFNIREKDLK